MIKYGASLLDWQDTQIQSVQWSETGSMYRIAVAASDDIIMQHRQLSRSHGREKDDHEDTAAMLATLPTALWSTGATDVGHCHSVTPITFAFDCPFPHYIGSRQYRHKPEAASLAVLSVLSTR